MSVFVCPPFDEDTWPTLGPQVCDFIEDYLCHGPGDLLGQDIELNDEQKAWIYRMYEVERPLIIRRSNGVISKSSNPRAGKRRFERCALSLRKGSSKTEFAAWIAACELHPEGPVRCDGFDSARNPVGRAVVDPYIPMISSTEEQTEELAYGALRRILQERPIGEDFDIGLERIMRLDGHGKAEAVSASPNARDGARTTHQHADETHRFTLDSLKRAWTVMLANLAKRPLAEPWALETTTAYSPGALSVAENTHEHALTLAARPDVERARLFFFHRQADDRFQIETEDGEIDEDQLRAAVIDASGPFIVKWTAVDRVVGAFSEPGADRAYLERVWLNRPRQAAGLAFDVARWRELKSDFVTPNGSAIALGFDGSRFDDATAIVATHIESGFQWPLGIWEKPKELPEWEVPVNEVDGVVSDAFERWHVCRMYCDPPKWETWVARWAEKHGSKRVAEWWTNRRKPMAYAIRSFITAIDSGDLSHDGSEVLSAHIGNARRQETKLVDEEGRTLWILRKERPDSPNKIDGAMAAVLSWEARNDSLAAGEAVTPQYDVMFL